MRRINSDDECLYQLQRGDASALEYIIRVYFSVLCAYADKIVKNRAQAEDITEDVLIKVWEKRPSFSSFKEVKAFLYTSIKNGCLNIIRSREREEKRLKELSAIENINYSDENEFIYEEMLAEIRKALLHLSPKQREIFIFSYFKKMSNGDIALKLNISEQTVRNQKSKAVSTVRSLLAGKTFALLLAITSI